jgi:death on curing protein
MREIGLADFLVLAEAVTGLDAAALALADHVVARAESALAAPFAEFGGVEVYEGLAVKAAVLCSRLVRNHPLPDGNKRVAYLCMIELIRRNGGEWRPVARTWNAPRWSTVSPGGISRKRISPPGWRRRSASGRGLPPAPRYTASSSTRLSLNVGAAPSSVSRWDVVT